jgi:hypothetical protein
MRENQLIFIDTNKYLDFYRSDTEAVFSLLKSLDRVHDRIITTYQVEMEFKKNRQNVILQSLSKIQPPNKIFFPAFLTETEDVVKIKESGDDIKNIIEKLKCDLKRVLSEPAVSDEVYKYCQKIFTVKSDTNLKEEDKEAKGIQMLARRRFRSGYPPKKDKDTSMGDAINWEWIINCALVEDASRVVIVSNDGDYGIVEGEQCFLNDFLSEEFKRRTKGTIKIILTNNLSKGLKELSISVSKEAAKAEERLIKDKVTWKTLLEDAQRRNRENLWNNTIDQNDKIPLSAKLNFLNLWEQLSQRDNS